MSELRLGILLWSQGTDWPFFEAGARRVEELGYDHLWTWDHLHAIFGEPQQPIFEGWLTLAAWAKVTTRIKLGLLVGANTFRNPGLVAKSATTLDHLSGGRAILGLGGAWFEYEHTAHGLEFGRSPGERLTWLDEAVGAVRQVLDGGSATSPEGGRYAFRNLRQEPVPLQARLPIMIGGSGERKTLRTVARYADMWNGMGRPEVMRRKVAALEAHCADVGRDCAEIERTIGCKPIIRDSRAEAEALWRRLMEHNQTPMSRVEADATFWVGTPEDVAEQWLAVRELGFRTAIAEIPAPFDDETLVRLVGEVKPLVERG
ncbi:MAG TPA: LLM class flavin-dependent oxidoreductase [Candidatus Limnocylindria bacterium]|nr:LLM class flavin-dependent oxidoreductase [Candidatus Limnocylindria bacterium]